MVDTKKALQRRLVLNRQLQELCGPLWEQHGKDLDAREFVYREDVPPEIRAQIAAVVMMLWRENVRDSVAQKIEQLKDD